VSAPIVDLEPELEALRRLVWIMARRADWLHVTDAELDDAPREARLVIVATTDGLLITAAHS